MAFVWVIGSGGLLGQALVGEIIQTEDALFNPEVKFNWNNPSIATEQLKQAANQFALLVAKGPWKIYWTAGTGTMHSTEEALQEETNILEELVSTLLSDSNLNLSAGTFIFASSAGAIYAGVQDEVITESTTPTPINAYGRAKLLQESLVNKLNNNGQGATIISCRVTTLYGFKPKDGKQQGLIAEMIRRAVSNQVVHIYVPLETMRDYIYAKNAAIQMIKTTEQLEKTPGSHLKIIASGVSTSVAQILAILKQIYKRNLRIVTQADVKSSQYQRVVQFQSEIHISTHQKDKHNLIEGISALLNTVQKDIAKNGVGS